MVDDLPISEGEREKHIHPGEDLLLTSQVAEREHVDPRTVLRWIEKGLPAQQASLAQIADLVARGLISRIPPHGCILLINRADLALIPQIRAYPKGTTRPRRGKTTGAATPERQ